MGGMHVFPGGGVHDEDHDLAISAHLTGDARPWSEADPDPELGLESADGARAYAVAAVRECCEEAGLLVGLDPPAPDLVAQARARLLAGESLARVLGALHLELDLRVLIPLSRWITPRGVPVRFDTRFYVARAPENQDASADGTESDEVAWRSPAAAMAAHRAGDIVLSPPTLCTLEDIEELSSVNQLLELAASRPAPCIEPVAAQIDGRKMILFPGDPEHPVRQRALRGPTRRPV